MEFKAKDYFPPILNSQYIYRGFDNNYLNFKKYIDYTDNSRIQIRFTNKKTELINIYEYTSDGVKLNYSKSNINYSQSFLNIKNKATDYIIKEPIKEGNKWSLSDGSIRYITNINAEVKTKLNLYKSALEIITITKNTEFSIDYYVYNIGLVKSIYYIDNVGLFYSELEEILDNSSLSQKVKIFFPDKNLNSIWYCEKDISFYSNDDISIIFSKEFESPPKGLLPLINQNTKINKMYYDFKKDYAYVDFSSDLLDSLSFENSHSSLIFSSIFETIKNYYNASNVSITINGIDYRQYFVKYDFSFKKPIQKWRIADCNLPLTYVVKNTDTLISISKKFNINYERLAKLNELKNPNSIHPGDVLQIYSSGIYSIKPTDNLKDICDNYDLDYKKIIKINNISNLTSLNPGQILKLY